MKEKNQAVEEAPTGATCEGENAPPDEPKEDAPPVPPAAPDPISQLAEAGFTICDLSEKDLEKIRNLEAVNRRFEQGSAQIMRGFLALLNEESNITNLKNQLAMTLKEKYEIPDGAQWQADADLGKLFFKAPENPPTPIKP